ncbi:hypothetical protein MRX96_021384 [Rhipicephalus microplus]
MTAKIKKVTRTTVKRNNGSTPQKRSERRHLAKQKEANKEGELRPPRIARLGLQRGHAGHSRKRQRNPKGRIVQAASKGEGIARFLFFSLSPLVCFVRATAPASLRPYIHLAQRNAQEEEEEESE